VVEGMFAISIKLGECSVEGHAGPQQLDDNDCKSPSPPGGPRLTRLIPFIPGPSQKPRRVFLGAVRRGAAASLTIKAALPAPDLAPGLIHRKDAGSDAAYHFGWRRVFCLSSLRLGAGSSPP